MPPSIAGSVGSMLVLATAAALGCNNILGITRIRADADAADSVVVDGSLDTSLGSDGGIEEGGLADASSESSDATERPADADADAEADVTEEASGNGSTSWDGQSAFEGGALGAAEDAGHKAADAAIDSSESEPISVRGIVIDSWRLPVSNARVSIGGGPAVSTDSDGHFQIDEVHPPYDIVFAEQRSLEVSIYEGLRTSNPTLQLRYPSQSHNWSASTQFHVQGGSLDAGTPAQVAFASDPRSASGDNVYGSCTLFEDELAEDKPPLIFYWYGRSSRAQGLFHLLRTAMAADGTTVDRYTAYQVVQGTLDFERQGAIVEFQLNGADPLEMTTLTVETDLMLDAVHVYVHFDAHAAVRVIHDKAPLTRKEYRVPKRDGWTYSVAGTSLNTETGETTIVYKQHFQAEAQVGLNVPLPAQLEAPNDGTRMDHGGEFWWRSDPGVNTLRLQVGSIQNGVRVNVVTTRRRVKFPQWSSSFAIPVPLSAASSWSVERNGGYASMDEIVKATGYAAPVRFYPNGADGLERIGLDDRNGFVATSRVRRFTSPEE